MNRDDLLGRIREILVDELGVDGTEVIPAADVRDDLEMDSLDLVELVTVLENQLGVTIDQGRVGDVRTVGDMLVVLESILAGASVAGVHDSGVSP